MARNGLFFSLLSGKRFRLFRSSRLCCAVSNVAGRCVVRYADRFRLDRGVLQAPANRPMDASCASGASMGGQRSGDLRMPPSGLNVEFLPQRASCDDGVAIMAIM